MENQALIGEALAVLKNYAPAGYSLAFHIHFTRPDFMFQAYSQEWREHYSRNGLVMRDPVVHWGAANTGVIRWSDLAEKDTHGVLKSAAEHGARYGFCYRPAFEGLPSLANFARSDREFSDTEIDKMCPLVDSLHKATAQAGTISEDTRDTLRRLSIVFTHP